LTFSVLAASAKWAIISDHPAFDVAAAAMAASNGGNGSSRAKAEAPAA